MITKQEANARLDEIDGLLAKLSEPGFSKRDVKEFLLDRKEIWKEAEKTADDDLFTSVLKSHIAVCKAKRMGGKEAFGHNPAVFYSLAVAGEAGEMANKIVKAMRNGDYHEACRNAIISELPDVFIYSVVLSHVLDLDIVKLVSDKAKIVIDRAESGYYGGTLNNRST